MTMPYSVSRALFEGNGAATQFPFAFRVWEESQLVVSLTSPQGKTSRATGWSASLGDNGGTVTYLHEGAPLPAGWKLSIVRNMPFSQDIDLVSGARFDPQVMEDGLDQAAAERQQLLEQISRAVIMPPTSEKTPETVAEEVLRARDEAITSAASALASEKASASSTSASHASATAALNSEKAALASASSAAGSEVNAAASEASAATSASNAAASAAHAASSEQAAAASAASAAGSAATAATDADTAEAAKDKILNMSTTAESLEYNADATANYNSATGVLAFGIPRGEPASVGYATPDVAGIVKIGDGINVSAVGAISIDPWAIYPLRSPLPVDGVKFGGPDGRRAIMPGETTARENWLLCDGGSDDAGGNVPDLRGRMLLGAGGTRTAGSSGGAETHNHSITGTVGATTLTEAQLASHGHAILTTTGGVNGWEYNPFGRGTSTGTNGSSIQSTGGSKSHTHALTARSGEASSLPPYYALAYIMRIA